jgi:hypothetical protein
VPFKVRAPLALFVLRCVRLWCTYRPFIDPCCVAVRTPLELAEFMQHALGLTAPGPICIMPLTGATASDAYNQPY